MADQAILSALADLGSELCDDCLSKATGILRRQSVNQRCRSLRGKGLVTRIDGKCRECGGHKLVNRYDEQNTIPNGSSNLTEQSAQRPWCWEGHVQARVAGFLRDTGWTVVRTADTASRERGKDIEAITSGNSRLWVTVKGYPLKSPDQQARHWFAEVLYDLIRYRSEDEGVLLGVGLPAHSTFRNLATRIAWLSGELPFQFYWVHKDGSVVPD